MAIAREIDAGLAAEKERVMREKCRNAGLISAAKKRGEAVDFIEEINKGKKFTVVENSRPGDIAAAAVGMSKPTYYRARNVVEAAEKDAEKFGDIVDRITGTSLDKGVELDALAKRTETWD